MTIALETLDKVGRTANSIGNIGIGRMDYYSRVRNAGSYRMDLYSIFETSPQAGWTITVELETLAYVHRILEMEDKRYMILFVCPYLL